MAAAKVWGRRNVLALTCFGYQCAGTTEAFVIRQIVTDEEIGNGRDTEIGNDLDQRINLILLRTVPSSKKLKLACMASTMTDRTQQQK